MRVQEVQGEYISLRILVQGTARGSHAQKQEIKRGIDRYGPCEDEEVIINGQGRNHARRCEGWIRQEEEISDGEN